MTWREFVAHLRLAREEQEQYAREGDPGFDPDRPDLRDPRFGRPPPESEMKWLPYHGDPDAT